MKKKLKKPGTSMQDKPPEKAENAKQNDAPKAWPFGRLTVAFATRLMIAGTACVLIIVLVLMAATHYLKKDASSDTPEEAPIALVEFSPLTVFAAQFDTLPEPTPTPVPVPDGAVDVLVDGVPSLALYSKQEAEKVLTAFLDMTAKAPEGEHLLSAAYACEILFVRASGTVPLLGDNDALLLLLSEPSLVPVTMITQKRTVDTGMAQVSEQSEPLLAKGARFLMQLGTGARTETVTQCTYIGGALAETGEPVSQVLTAARTTLIKNGTYRAKDPDTEPDEDEGKKGKTADELSLALPMKGSIQSYYGTRNGVMHNGIDIYAKAGTAVTAPAEGLILYCGTRGDYGYVVDIDHGNGFISRLTHLDNVALQRNQRVFKGDAIATLADEQSKPHLHYELLVDGIPLNPLFYVE